MASQIDEVYSQIRDAITFGKLKPGERLIEQKVCETFKSEGFHSVKLSVG